MLASPQFSIPANPQAAVNTDSQLYKSLGYCIAPDLVGPADIATARQSLDTMIAKLKEHQRPEALVEPHVLAEDWRFWLELCRRPTVIDAVQNCLQCDELILLMSHLIVKPAGDGLVTYWHQDNTYWPSVNGTDVTTVWLALDDVDVDNAAMYVIPNTHAGFEELEMLDTADPNLLNTRVEVTSEMENTAVPCALKQGSASLHDSFIIHGSEANRSNRRRAGYTMRYADAATVSVDSSKHNKPVYYVRGNGSHCDENYIDIRPGKDLPNQSGIEIRNEIESKLKKFNVE